MTFNRSRFTFQAAYSVRLFVATLAFLTSFVALQAQVVPIIGYEVDEFGRALLEVNSSSEKYYVLKVRNDLTGDYEVAASVTLGQEGTTVLTESLGSYPIEHYQVLEYDLDEPFDTDGDGIDDVEEYLNRPAMNPLNAAEELDITDGAVILDSFSLFNALSIAEEFVQFVEFLNGKRYSKFVITDLDAFPKIYFMNTTTHYLHSDFIEAKNIEIDENVERGQIVYHPTLVSSNGTLGTFGFNFSDGHGVDFEILQRTHEVLAASMPFLRNNLSYYVTERSEDEYSRDSVLIAESRIPIITEEDVFGDIDYWGLNQKEGYGFFRELAAGEIPDATDIVLLDALPNALPRVGGIITSVLQTPLSHVNLRAIQDNIPNAFIREPLSIDSIADLLNDYIYFKVLPDRFILRKATQSEVEAWYEDLRPTELVYPPLNLEFTRIRKLDDISFTMFDGFGTKCANVATMRSFGFPEGTIPDGFGVPFYFYHAFMNYNDLYTEMDALLKDELFMSNRKVREEKLAYFAEKIRRGEMPSWMLRQLADMQTSFPEGIPIRCRSSSNSEDLPGLSGAGLYDSRTHYLEEGHIEKSIKQVYASLWNLRAFDEREFYRVDHRTTAMAVLCHPSYKNEKANGVGVSADPIYQTYDSFYYLNTQKGEDLITNPGATSIPEELLLDIGYQDEDDFILIRGSNLVEDDSVILGPVYRPLIRDYLSVIHEEFEKLYGASDNETFAMEIEYKITSDDRLSIKQARPWISYEPVVDSTVTVKGEPSFRVYPNPAGSTIKAECIDCAITELYIVNLQGEFVQKERHGYRSNEPTEIRLDERIPGIYLLLGVGPDGSIRFSSKFVRLDH